MNSDMSINFCTCCMFCEEPAKESPIAILALGVISGVFSVFWFINTLLHSYTTEATCRQGVFCKNCNYTIAGTSYTERFCVWAPASETYMYYKSTSPGNPIAIDQKIVYIIFSLWFILISIGIIAKAISNLRIQRRDPIDREEAHIYH